MCQRPLGEFVQQISFLHVQVKHLSALCSRYQPILTKDCSEAEAEEGN